MHEAISVVDVALATPTFDDRSQPPGPATTAATNSESLIYAAGDVATPGARRRQGGIVARLSPRPTSETRKTGWLRDFPCCSGRCADRLHLGGGQILGCNHCYGRVLAPERRGEQLDLHGVGGAGKKDELVAARVLERRDVRLDGIGVLRRAARDHRA